MGHPLLLSLFASCYLAAQPHAPLASLPASFRFALLADPQLGKDGTQNPVGINAATTVSEAVAELNAMDPKPAFAVFVGDVVNVFEPDSVANFEKRIAPLEMEKVLVHGNHDSRPPYEPFLDLQQRVNGTRAAYYSFDAGAWHFVVLPCNLEGNSDVVRQTREAMFSWLDQDLEANNAKPTMVFEHLHLMPQGLTQTEWYTFEMPHRKRLIERLVRDGNVRYVFHGHVHNGIRVSEKNSWQYKGTNFVNVPTIIASRPYGETEVPGFGLAVQRAGYYMLADVQGEDVTLTGRAAGVTAEYAYPREFRVFDPRMEPRWFSSTPQLPANDFLVNGGFEEGLDGWSKVYRYQAEHNPGFVVEAQRSVVQEGQQAASVYVGSRGETWANDESIEIYQIVNLPAESTRISTGIHLPENFKSGGGFVRVELMRGEEFLFLIMAHWGEHESAADFLPRNVGFALTGEQTGWRYLQELAQAKRAIYLRLQPAPGEWQQLELNLPQLVNFGKGDTNAWAAMAPTKANITLGTWCNKELGSQSRACFDTVQATSADASAPSTFAGTSITLDASAFEISFADDLANREAKRAAREAKRNAGKSTE